MMKAKYYTCDKNAERFTHTSIDEAVEDYLFLMDLPWPETITVYGHAPKELTLAMTRAALNLVDHALDVLDDEYGDPEEATVGTPAMLAAERAFIDVLHREYRVWTCEKVCKVEVNVQEWLGRNALE